MFDSIFNNTTVSNYAIFICIVVALVSGILFSFVCSTCGTSSKGFYITNAMLPMAVTVVIALVNGNIGVGVAIAGAFSLVRFRSAQGSASEMCIIFISMASGMAFGTGYLMYGVIFLVISAVTYIVLEKTEVLNRLGKHVKILKITIPESLNYTDAFSEVFDKYLKKSELIKAKTTNMGSLYRVTYRVELKNDSQEKDFIDEIRVFNGNMEIMLERADIAADL